MKNFLLVIGIYLLSFQNVLAQALEIGAVVPSFELSLLKSEGKTISQKDIQGQVTILEFWATSCGPCIPSMQKLAGLEKDFKGQVQVIAISQESPDRIERFMENRNIELSYGYDHSESIQSFFPHRTIPHTVLIDQHGKVAAITRPNEVTPAVISTLLEGGSIQLPQKKDDVEFDYAIDYFQLDTNTRESFIIESAIPGVGTFSKQPNEGPFANRRISMHNFTIDGLYRLAYETSSYRMIYEVDESLFEYENPENKFCVDIVVATEEKQQLHQQLRQQIEGHFDVKARLEKRTITVAAMYQPDTLNIQLEKGDTQELLEARGDRFISNGGTFSDFADYLEGYGIVGLPVVDATNNDQLYNIQFRFEPENRNTFHEGLREMGLKLKKEEREVEVLVLYQ